MGDAAVAVDPARVGGVRGQEGEHRLERGGTKRRRRGVVEVRPSHGPGLDPGDAVVAAVGAARLEVWGWSRRTGRRACRGSSPGRGRRRRAGTAARRRRTGSTRRRWRGHRRAPRPGPRAVGGERVGDRGQRGARRVVPGARLHAAGRGRSRTGSRLGRRGPRPARRRARVEGAGEEAGQHVVLAEREGERGPLGGEVALRGAPGGAGAVLGVGALDGEVATAGQLLEMVAGDVGVQPNRSATSAVVTPPGASRTAR